MELAILEHRWFAENPAWNRHNLIPCVLILILRIQSAGEMDVAASESSQLNGCRTWVSLSFHIPNKLTAADCFDSAP